MLLWLAEQSGAATDAVLAGGGTVLGAAGTWLATYLRGRSRVAANQVAAAELESQCVRHDKRIAALELQQGQMKEALNDIRIGVRTVHGRFDELLRALALQRGNP